MLKLWYLVKIGIFGWNCEIWSKLWNLVEIVKFGWNCGATCISCKFGHQVAPHIVSFHEKYDIWLLRETKFSFRCRPLSFPCWPSHSTGIYWKLYLILQLYLIHIYMQFCFCVIELFQAKGHHDPLSSPNNQVYIFSTRHFMIQDLKQYSQSNVRTRIVHLLQ